MNSFDYSKLKFETKGILAISPAFAVTLYLERVHEPGILDFYNRSMESLGSLLLHYDTGGSKGRRPMNARARGIVPSWMGKMSKTKAGLFVEFSSLKQGAGPASLDLFVNAQPQSSDNPAEAIRGIQKLSSIHDKHGDVNVFISARLNVCFPVDHALAQDPLRMLSWVKQLQLVSGGHFASGHCGYTLKCDIATDAVAFAMEPRFAALCQQYPGLEFAVSPGVVRLLRYSAQQTKILHRVFRTNWLTLLSGNCVEQLGGIKVLRTALGDGAATIHELGNDAVILQAGPEPGFGDRSQRDFLPAYRQVARCIRPIRIDTLDRTPTGSFESWTQDWLEAFDHDPD